jgi:signal peptidase II
VDFLNVGVGSLRTGIFNVADVAVLLGAVLIVVGDLRPEKSEITIQ